MYLHELLTILKDMDPHSLVMWTDTRNQCLCPVTRDHVHTSLGQDPATARLLVDDPSTPRPFVVVGRFPDVPNL